MSPLQTPDLDDSIDTLDHEIDLTWVNEFDDEEDEEAAEEVLEDNTKMKM